MDIILDEKELALKSITTGYIDLSRPSSTIRTIIKYYYSTGMDKAQVRDKIELFMIENYIDYNPVNWMDKLDGMVKTYSKEKYNLIKIDSINITKGEFDKIEALKNVKLEKIAYVLLVYAKVLNKINPNNSGWVNKEINVLFKAAKLSETGKQQRLILKQLGDLEYIQIPKTVDNASIRVNFVDDDSEVVLENFDFENIILGYLKLKGENIICCEGCKHFIRQTSVNKKYCLVCGKDVEKEKTRLRVEKHRTNNKCNGMENPTTIDTTDL